MEYVNVCGYSNIVEIYRYEKEPTVGNRFHQPRQSFFTFADGGSHIFDGGEDLIGSTKFAKARSKESSSRAVVDFRRLVSANLSKSDCPVLASFTYRENMDSVTQGRADFNAFARVFRDSGVCSDSFRYIVVPEFQRRGALHFHALFWGLLPSVVTDERSSRLVANLWGHGFVDLVFTDGSHKIATYLSKYMSKNFADPRLFGQKSYIASRNVLRPWYDRGALLAPYFMGINNHNVDLSTAEVLHEKEYDTKWLGRAYYKKYLLNPLCLK